MNRVFSGIANLLNLRFCYLPQGFIFNADIYQASEQLFPEELTQHRFRGLHVIRDPRDVILSGMQYHLRSSEAWLHAPHPELSGVSYHDKLNSVERDERLLLEMTLVGLNTTQSMLDWNYEDYRFFEARYEDLIEDRNGALFSEILNFFGFKGEILNIGVRAFQENLLSATDYVRPNDPHVLSGRPGRWQSEFTRKDAQHFLDIMGNCLIQLGYEPDDQWINKLSQ